ncbi:MAG: ferredoxin [Desulfotalea sp.]|nr:MAG: ferredoxin [Desulfotalea sp.]
MDFPEIDLSQCSDCRGCIEIAPQVFRYNSATGLMEVVDCPFYPEDLVDEAISNCPKDCICWGRAGYL